MEKINKLKDLFKEENKKYHKISKLLNELYSINNQSLKNKEEIEYRIRFFTENIEDLKYLRDLILPKKQLNEKEEKEKKEEEKKEEIILKPEEIKELKECFNNIKKYVEELNNIYNKEQGKNKCKCISYYAFKQMFDGFINPNLIKEKEKKYIPKKKEILDENQRRQIQYNTYKTICELNQENKIKINLLFSKLSTINLELLEENQKNKLIEISIKIYDNLSENQRKIIKNKFYGLIKDKEIADILFLDTNKIFQETNKKNLDKEINYENIIEYLSLLIEGSSKEIYNNIYDIYGDKRKMNTKNVSEILLIIYKEFLIYKNKEKSFVNLNNCYIIEKIYYYFIINFLAFEDIFEDGKKFLEFLYVKNLIEKKYNFIELIKNKENIKKEIIIYSKEELKNRAKTEEKLKIDDLEEIDNNEEEDSIPNLLLMNNLKKIIPEDYIKLFLEIQQNISIFYIIPFPMNILVNNDNIHFTFKIIDMILFYRNYTAQDNWIKKYKNNLKNLEKDIFNYYIKSTSEYVNIEDNNKLVGYNINKRMKNAYVHLTKYLIKELPKDKDYEIQFIPFGSVTQFLSGKSGDIDLFLNIIPNNDDPFTNINDYHQEILNKLKHILAELDKNLIFHQTNRLCLFTFEYENIKIDINVYGICSYYGEILLREYSLMDFRFPMLVIYLKYIIGEYNIKNSEEKKIYINSFAWTNILLAFLQDILNPPLFPRLLNEKNRKRIKIKVGGGPGQNNKKELKDEIKYQRVRNFDVFKTDENKNYNIDKIKDNFYKKKEENNINKNKNEQNISKKIYTPKNKMPVAEILLKFVQYIGYFFNYRYTLVDSSYEYQGFVPKIDKIESRDDFVKIVYKKCDDPDNALLIREPFDNTYNPCKSVSPEKLDKIQKIFREIYINILEKGKI